MLKRTRNLECAPYKLLANFLTYLMVNGKNDGTNVKFMLLQFIIFSLTANNIYRVGVTWGRNNPTTSRHDYVLGVCD